MSVNLIATLTPQNNGAFNLMEDVYLKGSFRCVADNIERNAIPFDRRKLGMRAYVIATGLEWLLNSVGTNGVNLVDADWTSVSTGGGLTVTTLTYTPTVVVDFAAAQLQILALTGDVVLTTANVTAGALTTVRITADGTDRFVTPPGDLRGVTGVPGPLTVPANSTLTLQLTSYATTDADVVAEAEVQATRPFDADPAHVWAMDTLNTVDAAFANQVNLSTGGPGVTLVGSGGVLGGGYLHLNGALSFDVHTSSDIYSGAIGPSTTILLWVRYASVAAAAQFVVFRVGTPFNFAMAISLHDTGGGTLRAGLGSDPGSGPVLQPNVWNAVALNQNPGLNLFVNGVLTVVGGTVSNTQGNLYFGSDNTLANPFTGDIDQALVFNEHLSAAQIYEHYRRGAAGLLTRSVNLVATSSNHIVVDLKPGGPMQQVTLNNPADVATINRGPGHSGSIRIIGGGSDFGLTFPAGWTFLGGAAPTTLVAGKTAILSVNCYGVNETDVVAGYAVQP